MTVKAKSKRAFLTVLMPGGPRTSVSVGDVIEGEKSHMTNLARRGLVNLLPDADAPPQGGSPVDAGATGRTIKKVSTE